MSGFEKIPVCFALKYDSLVTVPTNFHISSFSVDLRISVFVPRTSWIRTNQRAVFLEPSLRSGTVSCKCPVFILRAEIAGCYTNYNNFAHSRK